MSCIHWVRGIFGGYVSKDLRVAGQALVSDERLYAETILKCRPTGKVALKQVNQRTGYGSLEVMLERQRPEI